MRSAMLKERVALHWFDRSLGQVMLPQQVDQSLALSGSVVGHLPNVMLGQNPVLEALALVLAPLLIVSGPWHLQVERSDCVDLESLRLFVRLLEGRARDAVLLEVRYVAEDARELEAARIREELERTSGFLGASVSPCDEPPAIFAQDPPQDERPEGLKQCARESFDAHAFSVSLRCAEGLLTEGAELEEASLIAGSSAHHLGPHDPVASARSAVHFGRLLELTDDPASACYALYRLSLHHAKHGGSLERALDCANRALTHASRMRDGRAAYFSAWAHNARAYVLYRTAHFAEAGQACERAAAALESAVSVAVPRREIEETLSHLRANAQRANRRSES